MTGLAGTSNTIEVPVSTDVGKYIRDMQLASKATEEFGDEVVGSTKETAKVAASAKKAGAGVKDLGNQAEKSAKSLKSTSDSLNKFGKSATAISTIVVGAGVAAAKMGADYEREFSKITGLVGIASETVAGMRVETLQLAGRTAQAPQALARAMFTLQSAGLRGGNAMAALDQSARLAAGGMGDVQTIAQASTSILDTYARKGIDAANAADFLAATARAGNFESTQLAGALGKVLPISSQLDIALSDVGGAVALLTRANGNASRSVTQVAATMRVLINPSEQARKIISDAGLSMADIRDTAAGPGGLVAALNQLYDATGQNDEQFAKLLGSEEAVLAAFQILNADSAALADTFGAVANSAGVADEVFEAAANTGSFQLEQSLNSLKVSAIEIGSRILPSLASGAQAITGFISSMVDAWTSLPGPVRDALKLFGSFALIAGPAALALSKVTAALAAFRAAQAARAAGQAATGLLALGPAGAAAAVGIGVAVTAWQAWNRANEEADRRASLYATTLAEAQGITSGLTLAVIESTGALVDQGAALAGNAEELAKLTPEAQAFLAVFDEAGSGDAVVQGLLNVGASLEDISAYFTGNATAEQIGRLEEAFARLGSTGTITGEELKGFAEAAITAGEASREGVKVANLQAQAWIDSAIAAGTFGVSQAKAARDMAEATGAANFLEIAASNLKSAYVDLPSTFTSLDGPIGSLEDAMLAGGFAVGQFNSEMASTGNVVREFGEGIKVSEKVAKAAGEAFDELVESLVGQTTGFNDATSAAGAYSDLLAGIAGGARGLTDAQIAGFKATEKFVEVLEEYNGSLSLSDESTQAFVSAARARSDSIRDETIAMAANGASVQQLQAFQQSAIAEFVNLATSSGISAQALRDFGIEVDAIPEDILIAMVADTEQAQADVEELIVSARELGTASPEVVAEFKTDQFQKELAVALLALRGFSEQDAVALLTTNRDAFNEELAIIQEELTDLEFAEIVAEVETKIANRNETRRGLDELGRPIPAQVELERVQTDLFEQDMADITVGRWSTQVEIQLEADTADRELNRFRNAAEAEVRTKLTIDGAQARAELSGFVTASRSTTVKAVVEKQTAEREISRFQTAQRITRVTARTDTDNATNEINRFKNLARSTRVAVRSDTSNAGITIDRFLERRRTATITANASTSSASAALSNLTRSRNLSTFLRLDNISSVEQSINHTTRPRTVQITGSYSGPTIGGSSGGIGVLHSGGVVGEGVPQFPDRGLRSDESLNVLQSGERVLSRRDNEWFTRTFLQGGGSSGGGSSAPPAGAAPITISPGAVRVEINGNADGGLVEAAVNRAFADLSNQLGIQRT